jgi:hypothetical protein
VLEARQKRPQVARTDRRRQHARASRHKISTCEKARRRSPGDSASTTREISATGIPVETVAMSTAEAGFQRRLYAVPTASPNEPAITVWTTMPTPPTRNETELAASIATNAVRARCRAASAAKGMIAKP